MGLHRLQPDITLGTLPVTENPQEVAQLRRGEGHQCRFSMAARAARQEPEALGLAFVLPLQLGRA